MEARDFGNCASKWVLCNLTKDIFVPYASGISAPFKIDYLMKSKPSLTRKDASTKGPERVACLLSSNHSTNDELPSFDFN